MKRGTLVETISPVWQTLLNDPKGEKETWDTTKTRKYRLSRPCFSDRRQEPVISGRVEDPVGPHTPSLYRPGHPHSDRVQ